MKIKLCYLMVWALIAIAQPARGENSFVVEHIKVNGLQRIAVGTVYNYLPISVGDTFHEKSIGESIRALFKTGFFKDISLEREDGVLIVNVVERPSISKIIIDGNQDFATDILITALKQNGFAEGKVFNQQILDKAEQELRRQYFSRGKYGVTVTTEIAPLTRNRVGINIEISEGRAAKIKQINIVGNAAYDNPRLLKTFRLDTTNWLSFYEKDDQYSKQKLSADLESLRSFYLDRGYINFAITSTQVAITPDKQNIYITINMHEGDVFILEKVRLSGDLIIASDDLIGLVQIDLGEIFSRKKATQTSKAIADKLGDEGFAFANVNMVPDLNMEEKTVAITFFIDPGKRTYVRRVNMIGNTKTRDEVLRRELRQMESSWVSTSKVERSKARLSRLGYFEQVDVATNPVVGTTDQVDVDYSVSERSSGSLSAGVGFSQTQGLVFNTSVSQDNIFGSGKRVGLDFNNSNTATRYAFSYLNPYFTLDGVSLGFNLSYRIRNASQSNVSRYSTGDIDLGLNFGIPLNEYDRLGLKIDLQSKNLTTSNTSGKLFDFIRSHGSTYTNLIITSGWTHDTLDQAIFPRSGGSKSVSVLATIPGSDLEYYKIFYRQQHYFPITQDFTLKLLGEIGYGDGYFGTKDLPPFEHYYVGGVKSIRGYDDNTVGPRDAGRPYGGSNKIVGKAELFFPVPFIEETKSIRLGIFIDSGGVSNSFGLAGYRFSTGLSGEWLSPFGAISVSFAAPLNAGSNDQQQAFQFSLGSRF